VEQFKCVAKDRSAAAQQLGLSVAPLATLPALRDIDILEDLKAWWQEQASKEPCAASLEAQTASAVADSRSASRHCTQATAAVCGLHAALQSSPVGGCFAGRT